jgi:hypothetical protein
VTDPLNIKTLQHKAYQLERIANDMERLDAALVRLFGNEWWKREEFAGVFMTQHKFAEVHEKVDD